MPMQVRGLASEWSTLGSFCCAHDRDHRFLRLFSQAVGAFSLWLDQLAFPNALRLASKYSVLPGLGEDFGELDPVPHLGIAGSDCAHRTQRPVNLQSHFQSGADGKWEHGFDKRI